MLHAFRPRRALAAVLLAAAVAVPAPSLAAGPVAAPASAPAGTIPPSATIKATIGSCFLSGVTQGSTTFRLTHRSATGSVKSKVTITADSLGEWERPCPGPKVASRDRLELRLVGDPTIFKAFTIPALTLVTDRVHSTVRGTAKGVAQVGLGLAFCDPVQTFCAKAGGADVPVDPVTHAFTWTTPKEATGLAMVRLTWEQGHDLVLLDRMFAHVSVRIGSAGVIVTGPRGGVTESATLRRGGSAVSTVSRRTSTLATFAGTFKRSGSPLKVRVGDKVTSSVAGDVSLKIPRLSLEVTSGGATGVCFKDQPFSVIVRGADGSEQSGASGITDDGGVWELGASIQAGWSVNAFCANAAGDIVRITEVAN